MRENTKIKGKKKIEISWKRICVFNLYAVPAVANPGLLIP